MQFEEGVFAPVGIQIKLSLQGVELIGRFALAASDDPGDLACLAVDHVSSLALHTLLHCHNNILLPRVFGERPATRLDCRLIFGFVGRFSHALLLLEVVDFVWHECVA